MTTTTKQWSSTFGGSPPREGTLGFGGEDGDGRQRRSPAVAELGLWSFLGSLTMLFAAFTSAYMVRRAASDWAPLTMPPLLWLNTTVLLGSSLAIEFGRRALSGWRPVAFRRWVITTFVLGSAFLGGQLLVWRQLLMDGIQLASTPHGSFLYILSGLHALHVLGGLFVLAYLWTRARGGDVNPLDSSPIQLATTYWHFVDGLWLYLLAVLFLW